MIVRENISFQRGLDPKQSLGIGKRNEIIEWFNWMEAVTGMDIDYTIKDDLSIIVNGNLELINTGVTKLPDNLTVNGYLSLKGSNILELPKKLSVLKSLDLENTKIKKIPDDLKVGINLYTKGSSLKPDDIPGRFYAPDRNNFKNKIG